MTTIEAEVFDLLLKCPPTLDPVTDNLQAVFQILRTDEGDARNVILNLEKKLLIEQVSVVRKTRDIKDSDSVQPLKRWKKP
jgi:hypothetical protein